MSSKLASKVNGCLAYILQCSFRVSEMAWNRFPDALRSVLNNSIHDAANSGAAAIEARKQMQAWCDSDDRHQDWREHEVSSAVGVPTGNAKAMIEKMDQTGRWAIDLALFQSLDGGNNRQAIRQAWVDCNDRIVQEKRDAVAAETAKAAAQDAAEQAEKDEAAGAALKEFAEGEAELAEPSDTAEDDVETDEIEAV